MLKDISVNTLPDWLKAKFNQAEGLGSLSNRERCCQIDLTLKDGYIWKKVNIFGRSEQGNFIFLLIDTSLITRFIKINHPTTSTKS